jgi:hypothetical protein
VKEDRYGGINLLILLPLTLHFFGRFSELDMGLKVRVCGGDGLKP